MSKYKLPKIEELIESGAHFGHQVRRWHPNMEPYIYTVQKNIHIIDLEQTVEMLKTAADFLYETTRKGGSVLFLGTKKQSRETIKIEAKRAGALYVTERWLGGTFTNFDVIKKNNIDKLLDLKRKRESGELEKYTKKERLLIDREIEKLERYVGGLTNMKKIPEVIYIIDGKREKTAVREARRVGVPVIALIDTNTNPDPIDYPIPGNDDAIRSIAILTRTIADAVEEGTKEYVKNLKEIGEKKKSEDKKTRDEDTLIVDDRDFVEITKKTLSGNEEEAAKQKGTDLDLVKSMREKKKETEDNQKDSAKSQEKKPKKQEKAEPKKRGRPKKSK